MHANLEMLLSQALSGSDTAFEQLVLHYRPQIREVCDRFYSKLPRQRYDVSDIVQDVFLEVAKAFRVRFHGKTVMEFEAWLRKISLCEMINSTRRQNCGKRDIRKDKVLDLCGSDAFAHNDRPSQQMRENEAISRLLQAINTLPEDQATAIRLRYLEGYALDSIAQIMGRTKNSVCILISRGLPQLRSRLKTFDL